MGANKKQMNRIAFVMTLILLFTGCFFALNKALSFEQRVAENTSVAEYPKTLFLEERDADKYMEEQGLSSSDTSVLRMDLVGRTNRALNRFFFNSYEAVPIGTVVIPNVAVIITVKISCHARQALGRILRFVHDSDGKKEAHKLSCPMI